MPSGAPVPCPSTLDRAQAIASLINFIKSAYVSTAENAGNCCFTLSSRNQSKQFAMKFPAVPCYKDTVTRNLGSAVSTAAAGYDAIGQLTDWKARETNTVRLNEQLGRAYDAAHNLYIRTNGALVQTFTVDAVNELTNVTRSGIVCPRLVPVAVGGETFIPGQFGNRRQPVGQRAVGGGQQGQIGPGQQGLASAALERDKVMAGVGRWASRGPCSCKKARPLSEVSNTRRTPLSR